MQRAALFMSGTGGKDLASPDRVIQDPVRRTILTILWAVEEAAFACLEPECGPTPGNLPSHLSKRPTRGSREAFASYSAALSRIDKHFAK